MGCLSSIAKYLLFLFNFLIVLCGIALIAVGAIILANENKGLSSITEFSVGGFAIAVGAIIFFIAFFGCCGAIKENSCLLLTYAIILIVLLVLQVVLGALAFVEINKDGDELGKAARKAVQEVFDNYVKNKDSDVINTIQSDWECCGVEGPSDWSEIVGGIPPSCYKDSSDSTTVFEEGCATTFKNIIVDNIKIIGGVALGFAVVELVGAIFAFMVRNNGK